MSVIEAQAEMADLADQVARGLSKASLIDGRAFVRTAVMFPSGSTVVVVIEREGGGDTFRVSDYGQGAEQAELLGILPIYRGQAKEVAVLSGIGFDGHGFELPRMGPGQLVGAAMAIANASGRALDRATQRAEQRKRDVAADRLVEKLSSVFAPSVVSRDVELRGASTHPWRFDAMVSAGDHRAIFDVVTPHQTSVAFATTKFHDIARLDPAPVRVAVVHRKASLHEFLSVVSQAARVIEDTAADRSWKRVAAAA